jgi:HEAT repeat protein
VKFEVLDDGSKELDMLRAVHAGKGREHLRLELKREEETVDGGLRITLQLCARNTGTEPLYLGSDYGLISGDPGGEEFADFSGPRSGIVRPVAPGEVKELGGWGWSPEGKKPGRHTVWVQYVAPKTRELIAESNRLTFDVPTPGTQTDAKSISELIRELQGSDHELAQAAMYELGDRGKPAVSALVAVVENYEAPARTLAVIALGIAKDPGTVPFVIQCLDDSDSEVRGRAAYALSQIGGDQARDALVAFLDKCLGNQDFGVNLTKATESLKELPDARALSSLMRVTDEAGRAKKPGTRLPYAARYAAIALGKIGDPRAAKSLAALLDPSMTYDGSTDRLVLEAIHDTKGKDALGPLVSYLADVVVKMRDQSELAADWTMNSPEVQSALMGKGLGAELRQASHNTAVYVLTIACLEAITGRKSQGATRGEVLEYWQDTVAKWNQDETSTAIERPDGSSGSHTAASSIVQSARTRTITDQAAA